MRIYYCQNKQQIEMTYLVCRVYNYSARCPCQQIAAVYATSIKWFAINLMRFEMGLHHIWHVILCVAFKRCFVKVCPTIQPVVMT